MINRGESTFVVVLIIFSTAAFWRAFEIAGFSKWSSPGVFPMLASGTMVLSCLFIFFGTRQRDRQNTRSENTDSTTADTVDANERVSAESAVNKTLISSPVLPARVAVVTLLLLLYTIAMPALGFLLSSGLFLFASIHYLWKKPQWLTLLISVLSLVIIHVVFRLAFQVILPQGTLINTLF